MTTMLADSRKQAIQRLVDEAGLAATE